MWRFPPITLCCLRCSLPARPAGATLLYAVFWLLAALGVGITPYFLPMAAIFALLLAVENALHTRKLLAPCGLFLGTCAAGYAAAWCWVR